MFSSSVIAEVSALMAEAERRFDLRIVALHNPLRAVSWGKGVTTVMVWTCPRAGEDADDADFRKRCESCRGFLDAARREAEPRWKPMSVIGLSDWSKWFNRFADCPMDFPLKDAGIGADLIGEIIYGQETMEWIHAAAREFFYAGIVEEWRIEAPRRHAERIAKWRAEDLRYAQYCRERRMLLNRHECAEVRGLVEWCANEVATGPTRLLVALDGSGRPLGKACEWFGVAAPVVYMDPHPLKWRLRGSEVPDKAVLAEAAEVLRRELSAVYEAWRTAPESVLVIDDQTGYGMTTKCLAALVGHISGRDAFRIATMSNYEEVNIPSWLRKRHIQGLEMVSEDGPFTFLSRNKPTEKSERFYALLRSMVLRFRNTPSVS